jgi:taurine transport system permease protein
VVLLSLWWIASERRWVPPLFLPSPRAIWQTFLSLQSEDSTGGTLLQHAGASLARVFGAFLLAALAAIPVGLSMGTSRIARGILDPLVEFYRPLPPLAYLPMTILWFGIGERQKGVLLFLAMFAPLALSARAGVRSVAAEQVQAALSLGASRRQVFLHVILRAALPEILTGMRIAIGFGWTTLVAAEMVAATRGLGQMVLNASGFLRTDIMVVGIVLIGLVACAFDLLMRQLERRLVPWKGQA